MLHFQFSFFIFTFCQAVTPEQVSILETKVAQCEAALATSRMNKKNSAASAKESATRIKAIEIEVFTNNMIKRFDTII